MTFVSGAMYTIKLQVCVNTTRRQLNMHNAIAYSIKYRVE